MFSYLEINISITTASQSETFSPYIVTDIALTLAARGGIFLGGGILIHITDFLYKSEFMQGFIAKDKVKDIWKI